MLRADGAEVSWDAAKKMWRIRIRIGEEAVRRPVPKLPRDAADDVLRSTALRTAEDEGYQVDPANVKILR